MSIVMQYLDNFHEILDTYADPRTTKWFLMSSPLYTAGICLSYVYLVKVLGPKLMENRKPFQLKKVLIAYNLFQVIFSTWIFYEISISGWLTGHYSLRCQPIEKQDDPRVLRMAHACWWYYFSKFTEFFDTIFFVMRKKTDHVSPLHVIHHGIMPMSVWFGVKYTPGGHATFFGLLNTFVHIIMYSYYLLAALGPSIQPYLWWKKYLTALQMIQFLAIILHAFQLVFIDCNYPKAVVWFVGLHAVMFYFLFNNFYKQKYVSKDNKSRVKSAAIDTIEAVTGACMPNNISNGKNYSSTNGKRRDAADYYVKGEIATNDVNLRKSYKTTD
ncbi:elongation of very long chain fatty acids protein AAEL008004-like isoform X2 [Aphidius gifuensis]|uniref:elongation of very long chain fatty acids protein AAEL008004-like isoform X2 n=1 Tax=Aphidius gifuensis TaxID=684658 RepID=UPI001CDB72FB|nr:elongation of very long chain fatty acids protein AAEL008004-like isoform X2 [Aphidius gifuensis]